MADTLTCTCIGHAGLQPRVPWGCSLGHVGLQVGLQVGVEVGLQACALAASMRLGLG